MDSLGLHLWDFMWVLGTIPLVLLTHPLFNYTALHPTVLESDSGVEPAIRSFYRTQIHRLYSSELRSLLWNKPVKIHWKMMVNKVNKDAKEFIFGNLLNHSIFQKQPDININFLWPWTEIRGAKLRSPVNMLFRPITNGNRRFFFAIYLIEVHRSTSQKKEKSKKGKIYLFLLRQYCFRWAAWKRGCLH